MKRFVFIILFIIFYAISLDVAKYEELIYSNESKVKISPEFMPVVLKLSGLRKATTSLLWIKHGLQIGDIISKDEKREFKMKQLNQNSRNIAYLSPYFKQNYYTSSTVLAFIKTLKAHKEAMEILKIGIDNNPNEILFKKYAGAIIAKSENDTEKLILIMETILNEKFDDEIALFLSKIYEKKHSETGKPFFLKKQVSLLETVSVYGTEKNKKIALDMLVELKNGKEVSNKI